MTDNDKHTSFPSYILNYHPELVSVTNAGLERKRATPVGGMENT
jgi:hypothetical protein